MFSSSLYKKEEHNKHKIDPNIKKYTDVPRNNTQKLIVTISYSKGCSLSSFFLLPPCSLVIHLQNAVCQRFWSSVLYSL